MSSKPRFSIVPSDRATRPAKPSLPNMFGKPVGRSGRRVADRVGARRVVRPRFLPLADVTRDAAIDRWVALINRHCGTSEACAAMFGVTFQTACNWFDGVSAPSAAAVFQALDWWGDDLARGAVRRAA